MVGDLLELGDGRQLAAEGALGALLSRGVEFAEQYRAGIDAVAAFVQGDLVAAAGAPRGALPPAVARIVSSVAVGARVIYILEVGPFSVRRFFYVLYDHDRRIGSGKISPISLFIFPDSTKSQIRVSETKVQYRAIALFEVNVFFRS